MRSHMWQRLVLASVLVALGCKDDAPAQPEGPAAQLTAPAPQPPPAKAAPVEVKKVADSVLGSDHVPVDELEKRLASYARVEVTFDDSLLGDRDKALVAKLVEAAEVMDRLFWLQASTDGLQIRERLRASSLPLDRELLHYVQINYGRFDRLKDHEPFIGKTLKPLGAAFYPRDMSREEFEQWLRDHPEDRPAFTSPFTVIRKMEGKLLAVTYADAFHHDLEEAGSLLREAAGLTFNSTLKAFLQSRAVSLLSNDYYRSDLDWMDVKDSLVEVTIGPYEVYEDRLFNYKAAFEAFIVLRDPEESRKLGQIAALLPDMESALPVDDKFKNPRRGAASPIVVADLLYSSGDTRAGVQTIAFNLPNDEKVREAKGSKKVLMRNVMKAKYEKILLPIAKKVMRDDQVGLVSADAYFNHTLMHEMSHGLGPGNIRTADGQRTTVNVALKETYSALEEAKADVLGSLNSLFLVDRGVLAPPLREQILATFLAGIFRSVRFGAEEAHGKANALIYNYMVEAGAYAYDKQTGRYGVDFAKAPDALRSLASQILTIQGAGDYEGAGKLLERHGKLPQEIDATVRGLSAIPTDIEPLYQVRPPR